MNIAINKCNKLGRGFYNFIILMLLSVIFLNSSCQRRNKGTGVDPNKTLSNLLNEYWEERMQLYPVEATGYGDYRYNDKMTILISESFRDTLKQFYIKYLNRLDSIKEDKLNAEDKVTYDVFKYEMQMNIEGFKYPTHLMPINQFWSVTLDMPQMGAGTGIQPFKNVKDYDNWLKRLQVFPAWTDTAIANMRKGIATGWVLPKVLVLKILPQLKAMLMDSATQSTFYGPIKMMADSFNANDKKRLTDAYTQAIEMIIIPNYKKLYDFFEKEYLPASSATHGVNALPGGNDYYAYCIRYWTTTNLTPDSIYNLGLNEVNRIEGEMKNILDSLPQPYLRNMDISPENYEKSKLKLFFTYLNTDKQFFPFNTVQQVIDSFWNIKKAEDPQLKKLFNHAPKTAFEIRETEKFREASASAEYNQGSANGTRPGIFYVPVPNPATFNATGMETLFLHEAIPGHHYQISLQQENKDLPQFRRFLWYGAYGEGWALYCESLGKELGVYKNPYQYFGHLSDEIHRAIRLVVDVGIHYKGMSREDAIAYMMAHERSTEAEATAEVERYMAIPGQALSYKIGQLTIRGLRTEYEQKLGTHFNVADFHDQVLMNGCLPLNILESNMGAWDAKKK